VRFDFWEVGGAVRDGLLGIHSKDRDFVVVDREATVLSTVEESFAALEGFLEAEGFKVFLSKPEFVTIRAKFPAGHMHAGLDADFVLARKEGPYSDGRHPDWVAPGTLSDDLARRDFTVNAIASDGRGRFVDPFGGKADLARMLLRCVGSAEERLHEDALRALRAIRFRVTKGFEWDRDLTDALGSTWLPPLLASVSAERRREELERCFRVDTLETLNILTTFTTRDFRFALFDGGLRLSATMKG
jgi:tRNA nucleotidyltransferase/poly(A) polymerase